METRNTSQKIKIIQYLKSVKTHPSAEMVYMQVRKDLPTISLATVYRNLNQMADNGQILKLEINKGLRFDGDTCWHQHCVCNDCGAITDTFLGEISEFAMDKFKNDKFTPESVNIIYYGHCKSCGGV